MEVKILVLQISGYIVLFYENWKIALGVFLIHWSINKKCCNSTSANRWEELLNEIEE